MGNFSNGLSTVNLLNLFSLAVVRHNLALESIVVNYKVTNIKGKLTGHLSALSNFRYGHYSMYRYCSIRVIAHFLIISPNSF